MISLKKTSITFLVALGLVGAACGDDEKKEGSDAGGGGADAGSTGGEGDAGSTGTMNGKECSGAYDGYTEMQLTDNIQDAEGKCANAADIAGVCTQDPSGKAREVGVPCYFALANPDLDPMVVAEMTGDCAYNGRGTAKGLKDILTGMSEGCVKDCYVGAVVCSAQNCAKDCGTGTAEECDACRAAKGCTEAFFVCSGLPTGDQIEAAK